MRVGYHADGLPSRGSGQGQVLQFFTGEAAVGIQPAVIEDEYVQSVDHVVLILCLDGSSPGRVRQEIQGKSRGLCLFKACAAFLWLARMQS